jgi:hypothetical protein
MTATVAERLVGRLAGHFSRAERSRRGFLGGAALVGAALAVIPGGYLTRPISAYAAACGTDSECSSGYSVFCCTINDGKNACPPNTFVGGWWKADRSSYCGGKARYYIDCNANPGHHFACHCHKTTCDRRLVACNVFRYGQCNTQIPEVTAVVCRQISCRPPWEVHPKACGRSSATDNNTAGHTAPCLTAANTFPVLTRFPEAPNELRAGHTLHAGDRLTSLDRHTTCVMHEGGNLAVRNSEGTLWFSHTHPAARGGHATLEPSGNLVIFDRNGRRVWTSGTAGTGGRPRLHLRDSGLLVIYNGERVVWSSR